MITSIVGESFWNYSTSACDRNSPKTEHRKNDLNLTKTHKSKVQQHITSHHCKWPSLKKKKKTTKNKCWRRCGGKETLFYCWWEYTLIQPVWRTVWRFLWKLETKLSYDPEMPCTKMVWWTYFVEPK